MQLHLGTDKLRTTHVQEERHGVWGYGWSHATGAVDEYEFGSAPDDGFYQDSGRAGPSELPPAELGSLAELVKVVTECSPFAREKIANLALKKGYLRQLLDLFKTCEDLDDMESLHMMYTLVRGLVLLNDANLFDELLRDENVFDVVGALEYDPEYSEAEETGRDGVGDAGERTGVGAQQKVQHRAFLRDSVVFKEVVPIQDPAIRAKIHQTYRIGYLKDVILPRVLDDATFGTLTSIMLFNNVEVVLALQQDPAFLKELFNRLKSTRARTRDGTTWWASSRSCARSRSTSRFSSAGHCSPRSSSTGCFTC